MPESLEFNKTPEGEILSTLYDGKTFPDKAAELRFLQRLQTSGEIDGVKWSPVHFERSLALEKKRRAGPSPEQRERYNYLTRLRNENNDPWSDELKKEFIELQDLIDRQKSALIKD
jgi:hypothetical protein